MDNQLLQALVMGITQGLTEFLPVSSSGHLILVPYLFGWDDPFIESLAFSVVLHAGTLLALLVYFRADWLRLVPAGLATIRDRSFRGDPDRKLAWMIALSTIPAAIAAVLLNDVIESAVRQPGLVAVALVVGAGILWLADRWGARTKGTEDVGPAIALGLGAAQALALIPGVSRSGISVSAALFAGLRRVDAVRYSFLMATPITAAAVLYEGVKLVRGDVVGATPGVLVVGVVSAFISGILAIAVLLRYVRTQSFTIFVVYRLVLAAVVVAVFLSR
jgi:undecaprenyl-diphosphatase